MKTRVDYIFNTGKYEVRWKEKGFFQRWIYEKSFEKLEDAENFAKEFSKYPNPISLYKNGVRTK